MKLEFSDQVWLIVIENGLIALILFLVGYLAKCSLERFKSEQSLESELNRLRVNKVGECFAIHSKYE